LNTEPLHNVNGVRSTETFTYLEIVKEAYLYSWSAALRPGISRKSVPF